MAPNISLTLWLVVVMTFIVQSRGEFKRERLAVTFGKWNSLPLTITDAKSKNWTLDAGCQDPKPNFFKGNRYVLGQDKTTRLLFDCRGQIAGIQATVKPPSSFPTKHNSAPWTKNSDGTISASAYFRDPRKICKCKKCKKGPKGPLVGDRLWIQEGRIEDYKFTEIPLNTNNLKNEPWVEGNCFKYMGMHHHYNISKSFDCSYGKPFFLISDNKSGDVHGFGWGVPFLVPSARWEKPRPELFARSVKKEDLPDCIKNYQVVSVQHIYFVNALKISC